MPRQARVVIPDHPHHVTQRGNRKLPTFFRESDYSLYLSLMEEQCVKHGVKIWSYCLMSNHVHLIAVPCAPDSLAQAIGGAHRKYSAMINKREGWTGYLWQGRFGSCVMDESHTLCAARYIAHNPVEAGLVKVPEDYHWSSAQAHKTGVNDRLADVQILKGMIGDWDSFMQTDSEVSSFSQKLEKHAGGGWPLGGEMFLKQIGAAFEGRSIMPVSRGRPARI
jgi:putative transposase